MKNAFKVINISGNNITVNSVLNGQKNNTISYNLEVKNPAGYEIKIGSKVFIGFSKKEETMRCAGALLFPLVSAFLGITAAPAFANILSIELTEMFKMFCISLFFIIACTAVFLISRRTHAIMDLHIIGIAE